MHAGPDWPFRAGAAPSPGGRRPAGRRPHLVFLDGL